MRYRVRRAAVLLLVPVVLFLGAAYERSRPPEPAFEASQITQETETQPAKEALDQLEVKGRAPKTGYKRAQFGPGWADYQSCDTRNLVLQRDLAPKMISSDGCKVVSGILRDPYTGREVSFRRGESSSALVQIDHVVALSDAWQKGAQLLSQNERVAFANDPLNLLAVDGPANQNKGDGDAATWLPPNKPYRCQYIARQIAVKLKYHLWVTEAEKNAMSRVLGACPTQQLPAEIKTS